MSASASVPWGDFSADPRVPANASLRASDRDRDLVLGVLAEAYADGRLTREEYDERAEAASRTKTLGELPGVIADLVPLTASRSLAVPGSGSPEELHERAVRAYQASRRNALSSLLTTTLVLTAIWWFLGHGGFYWPVFVIALTSANLVRVLVHRQDMIDEEQRRLERRERRRLDPPPDHP